MNLQMLKMLGMQMLVPKLKEMSLDEINALRALLNELFDAATREKEAALLLGAAQDGRELTDGG